MSKFKGLLDAKREQVPTMDTSEIVLPAAGTGSKPGRPRAKRSDPNYVQTSPYIKKTTLQAVKMQLLSEGQGREYSELVEELLLEWLNTQKPESSKT